MANNVKGTRDILPITSNGFSKIESLLSSIATLFNYHEIRTPVLEYSEVFSRGVGEGSDIVRKEMYTFLDKGDRSVTMRPEFTAGIVRSFIQNKMYATEELPVKLFYCGPAFRYERPQLGRYRQFTQFGVESLGCNSLYNDAEVISMAYSMLLALGLDNVKLKINCLGDEQSRSNYKEALKAYFKPHLEEMCPDCKQRYELNPLRILDCKVPYDHELALGAPKIAEYLSTESKERFDKIKEFLDKSKINYEIDDQLVRGLDYYSEIVFEFAYVSKKGKDYGALGGGGHYGHLIKELGGPDLPGVGFSFGIDRLLDVLLDDEILKEEVPAVDLYVMPIGSNVRSEALNLTNMLRLSGYKTDLCFDDIKLGSMFKRATKKGAKFAIILGEDEVKNNKVIIKDLSKEEQKEIEVKDLLSYLDELYRSHHCHCHSHEGECCSSEEGCECDSNSGCKCHQ